MARNIFFFLMVGVFIGALAGVAVAGYDGEAPQSAAAEEQMPSGHAFAAVGGVADYWPEDQMSAESRFVAVGGVADYWPEDQMSAESRFAAVGGVADYWPEDGIDNLTQERGPVETGALPEKSEGPGNDVPMVEIGGLMYRIGIDTP